jgi:hypothetical protein
MPLTEPQARILAALAALEPTKALTVRQLCDHAERKDGGTRAAVNALAESGLALGNRGSPITWRITPRGRTLLGRPPYRAWFPSPTTKNGANA